MYFQGLKSMNDLCFNFYQLEEKWNTTALAVDNVDKIEEGGPLRFYVCEFTCSEGCNNYIKLANGQPCKLSQIFQFFRFYVVKLTGECSVSSHEIEDLIFSNVIMLFLDGLALDTTEKLDIVSNSMIVSLEILLVGGCWLNFVLNY